MECKRKIGRMQTAMHLRSHVISSYKKPHFCVVRNQHYSDKYNVIQTFFLSYMRINALLLRFNIIFVISESENRTVLIDFLISFSTSLRFNEMKYLICVFLTHVNIKVKCVSRRFEVNQWLGFFLLLTFINKKNKPNSKLFYIIKIKDNFISY